METIKIRFADKPSVEIVNGNYKRRFDRSEQPFEVTEVEWEHLQRRGLFEIVPEAVEEAAPASEGNRIAAGGTSETPGLKADDNVPAISPPPPPPPPAEDDLSTSARSRKNRA